MIPIKRWQVTSSGKQLVLYGDTPDEIREKWNCVDKDCDIVPYENDEYIDMIDKIKEKAEYITSFKMVKPKIPLALDGGTNGVRSNYYRLLEKQKSSQISITISPDFCL